MPREPNTEGGLAKTYGKWTETRRSSVARKKEFEVKAELKCGWLEQDWVRDTAWDNMKKDKNWQPRHSVRNFQNDSLCQGYFIAD